jgi:glycosyltransferase involved in cell wall biosynthesis
MKERTMMLKGDYLFIAGNALYNRLNQPAKRLPFALAPHVERLDVVGYVNFYGGAPAPAWHRLAKGVQNTIQDRIHMQECGSLREIAVRKLHMPQPLEMTAQAFWLENCLRSHLRPVYRMGIVSGPENCSIAEHLLESGRIERLIYYDTDHFPSYVAHQWSGIADRQERRMMALADGVVSVSQSLAKLRHQQGAKAVTVINNAASYTMLSQAYHKRVPHPFTLIYTGTLDLRWGIDIVIAAMPAILSRIPDARLIIVGDGPDEDALKASAQQFGVTESVLFAGRAEYEDLPEWMSQADIGVATSRPNAFRKYASPMKVADYLAAGLVVLCSGGGDGARLVMESKGGLCVDPDAGSIADAVIKLSTDREQMRHISANAVSYARGLSWQHAGEQLAAFMAQFLAPYPQRERV